MNWSEQLSNTGITSVVLRIPLICQQDSKTRQPVVLDNTCSINTPHVQEKACLRYHQLATEFTNLTGAFLLMTHTNRAGY